MATPNVQNVEETNSQILSDIQNLQSLEQEMFSDLEENPSLTQQEQQAIIQKINQVSSMRLNLYKTLSGVTGYFQNSLYNSQGVLEEQVTAIDIVEQELNRAKQKLRILEEDKNNKIRLVEINTYYGEKYQEHAELMKIIIFTLIPIIILAILYSKGILPQTVYYVLIVIVAAIGSYFMWFRIASIWNRDNMDYQEYTWPDPPSASTATSSTSGDPWGVKINTSLGCVDEYCCATGTVFDGNTNLCIPSSSSTSTSTGSSTPAAVDGFDTLSGTSISGTSISGTSSSSLASSSSITEAFTKHSRITKKPSVTLNSTYLPKMTNSFIYK